jgi:hypothetical protein
MERLKIGISLAGLERTENFIVLYLHLPDYVCQTYLAQSGNSVSARLPWARNHQEDIYWQFYISQAYFERFEICVKLADFGRTKNFTVLYLHLPDHM